MMASATNIVDELKPHPNRFSLVDIELLSAPDEEDEDDLDAPTTDFENLQNISSSLFIPRTSVQPRTDLSTVTKPIPRKTSLSRSYQFVQLERALTLANLLENKEDRVKFEHDYRQSLRENKFQEFLQISYQKLQDHRDKIKREQRLKRSQTFTFVDLEKNFLALDPTHDVKIVFIDDPIPSSTLKIKGTHRNSALAIQSDDDDDADIETFYKNRSRRLLRNPSRARDEINLFARHASERLHERLSRLTRVPHRVQIIDQRETKRDIDKHTLLQMKHKHALSLITKRRQLMMKMITQTKQNQLKMTRLNLQTPLTTMNHSSCCRELLERIDEIEDMIHLEHFQRSQTTFTSGRTLSKTTNYSSTQTTTMSGNRTSSFSSPCTPFQDTLSIHHVEKTPHVHVIQSKRPLTAPIPKMSWINYC